LRLLSLLLRLERAVVLLAIMPSHGKVVHVDSVLLDAALLIRPVLAPKLRAVMPHDVDAVNRGLVVLQIAATYLS